MFWPDTVPLPKSSVTGIFSELNPAVASGQYQISTHISVSDQYAHICIRPVWIACLRAVFVELIQSCRTDTDPIYCLISDPLPKSSVAFLGTDLDQIGSSSDSKCRILLCMQLRWPTYGWSNKNVLKCTQTFTYGELQTTGNFPCWLAIKLNFWLGPFTQWLLTLKKSVALPATIIDYWHWPAVA